MRSNALHNRARRRAALDGHGQFTRQSLRTRPPAAGVPQTLAVFDWELDVGEPGSQPLLGQGAWRRGQGQRHPMLPEQGRQPEKAAFEHPRPARKPRQPVHVGNPSRARRCVRRCDSPFGRRPLSQPLAAQESHQAAQSSCLPEHHMPRRRQIVHDGSTGRDDIRLRARPAPVYEPRRRAPHRRTHWLSERPGPGRSNAPSRTPDARGAAWDTGEA